MSKIDEQKVSDILSQNLGIELTNSKFRLDGWGEVDNWAMIDKDAYS